MLFAPRRSWWVALCAGLLLLAQIIFPVLYAWHEYYYAAIAVLLMTALALSADLVVATRRLALVGWLLIGPILAGQGLLYFKSLYQLQRAVDFGGSEITDAIRAFVPADDVLIIAGDDWNSMTPFYSQRRALMLRRNMENDGGFLQEAFGNLTGETVGALVLSGDKQENTKLRAAVCERFGIQPVASLSAYGTTVYLRPEIHEAMAKYPMIMARLGIGLLENGKAAPDPFRERIVAYADLPKRMVPALADFKPLPSRIYTRFGTGALVEGRSRFVNAHPDTSFWFKTSAGRHRIRAEYVIVASAYTNVSPSDATDGVLFAISFVAPDGSRKKLFERLLAPASTEADRGIQKVSLDVDLDSAGEIQFETSPGPAHNYSRDWAGWGSIRISNSD